MISEQKQKALELLRGGWVRWANEPEGKPMYVSAVTARGMVELLGYPGEFAPHLFVPVPFTAPGEGVQR